MGLIDILTKGIAIADKTTKDMQCEVVLSPWIGQVRGKDTFGSSVTVDALVDLSTVTIRMPDGQMAQAKGVVTVLQIVAANGADDRSEPVDTRDKVTLPNGKISRILYVKGFVSRLTSKPLLQEIYLGD